MSERGQMPDDAVGASVVIDDDGPDVHALRVAVEEDHRRGDPLEEGVVGRERGDDESADAPGEKAIDHLSLEFGIPGVARHAEVDAARERHLLDLLDGLGKEGVTDRWHDDAHGVIDPLAQDLAMRST